VVEEELVKVVYYEEFAGNVRYVLHGVTNVCSQEEIRLPLTLATRAITRVTVHVMLRVQQRLSRRLDDEHALHVATSVHPRSNECHDECASPLRRRRRRVPTVERFRARKEKAKRKCWQRCEA